MRSSFKSTKAHPRSRDSSSRGRSSFPGTLSSWWRRFLTGDRRPRRDVGAARFRATETEGAEARLEALSVRATQLPRARRRRRARVRLIWQWSLLVGAVVVLGATTLGLAFAGSPERLP